MKALQSIGQAGSGTSIYWAWSTYCTMSVSCRCEVDTSAANGFWKGRSTGRSPFGSARVAAERVCAAKVDDAAHRRTVGGWRSAHHEVAQRQISVTQPGTMHCCEPPLKSQIGLARQTLLQQAAQHRSVWQQGLGFRFERARFYSIMYNEQSRRALHRQHAS